MSHVTGPPMDQPLQAVLLGRLRVTPEPEPAEGIEQLSYFPGGASGCPHNLLVLGGQMLEMPSALTILPLDCLWDGPAEVTCNLLYVQGLHRGVDSCNTQLQRVA